MRRPALIVAILCAVTLVAYWPAFSGWNLYDDAHWIPEILTPITLRPTWDLAHWSLSLNAWLGGTTPWGYHLVNIGIHCVNGMLVYRLAYRMIGPTEDFRADHRIPALLAAAVFLLHPIQTEAVAYLSGRWELVSTMCVLLACVAPWQEATVVSVLAMTTKTSAIVVLPLLLLVRKRGDDPVLIFPILGAVLVAGLAFYADRVGRVAYLFQSPYGPIEYAARQAVAFGRMLALVVVPWGQTVDHDWIHVPFVAVILAIPALLGSVVEVIKRRKDDPMLWLAACWILICVAPRFVVRTPELLSEHHMYLPMVGVSLAVGAWTRR